MKKYLYLLFTICTFSACYLNPEAYAERYPIDGVVFPEVKEYEVDFCQTKKTECLSNIKDALESKLPMYERVREETLLTQSTFLSYYDPLSRYCEFRIFSGLDPQYREGCPEAMKLVCDRVYDECAKSASNYNQPTEEEKEEDDDSELDAMEKFHRMKTFFRFIFGSGTEKEEEESE